MAEQDMCSSPLHTTRYGGSERLMGHMVIGASECLVMELLLGPSLLSVELHYAAPSSLSALGSRIAL